MSNLHGPTNEMEKNKFSNLLKLSNSSSNWIWCVICSSSFTKSKPSGKIGIFVLPHLHEDFNHILYSLADFSLIQNSTKSLKDGCVGFRWVFGEKKLQPREWNQRRFQWSCLLAVQGGGLGFGSQQLHVREIGWWDGRGRWSRKVVVEWQMN